VKEVVASKIPKLINKQNIQKENTEQPIQNVSRMEYYKETRNKPNQLIITKADKGNTLIILHKDDYNVPCSGLLDLF
jgi:hypothetical protein